MAKKAVQVQELSVDELQQQREPLSVQRGQLKTKIRDLQHKIANPDLSPTLSFEEACAAIADHDQELRAAQAMLTATEQQISAINTAIAQAREREKQARLEVLRPKEEAAKANLIAAFLAYVQALKDATAVSKEIQQAGGSSALSEVVRRDTRLSMRKQGGLIGHFLDDSVDENAMS